MKSVQAGTAADQNEDMCDRPSHPVAREEGQSLVEHVNDSAESHPQSLLRSLSSVAFSDLYLRVNSAFLVCRRRADAV